MMVVFQWWPSVGELPPKEVCKGSLLAGFKLLIFYPIKLSWVFEIFYAIVDLIKTSEIHQPL